MQRKNTTVFVLLGLALVSTEASAGPGPTTQAAEPGTSSAVRFSGGAGGIGFDDLIFARGIRKIVAPSGGTGNLNLVDPDTHAVAAIGGFSASGKTFSGGHGQGTTSADEGRGLLFAIDRSALLLDVVEPKTKKIVASAKLASSPDYVRWVETTNEVWVTQPDSDRIEVFSIPSGPSPQPAHAAFIAVKDGPESLVIDATRKKAFTHLWKGASIVIDLRARAVLSTWPNGCEGSRGIALDARRGFLFAGCAEGKAVVLDVDHGGRQLGSATSGAGVDVIDYSPKLSHLYLPGAKSATMAILGVSATGQLTVLGTVKTAPGAHCVAADDRDNAWVCDVNAGHLLAFKDTYPASGR